MRLSVVSTLVPYAGGIFTWLGRGTRCVIGRFAALKESQIPNHGNADLQTKDEIRYDPSERCQVINWNLPLLPPTVSIMSRQRLSLLRILPARKRAAKGRDSTEVRSAS